MSEQEAMTITNEMRAAVPSPLYPCAEPGCAEQHTFPADDLAWLPSKGGFYCTAPIESCWEFRCTDEDRKTGGQSLATVLADIDIRNIMAT